MALVDGIKAAKAASASDDRLSAARQLQRRGRLYVDFVQSENSNGFLAPGEAARILGEAIDACRKGQVSLRQVATNSRRPAKAR
jgi:nitrite reductase (cytochrome c-552)